MTATIRERLAVRGDVFVEGAVRVHETPDLIPMYEAVCPVCGAIMEGRSKTPMGFQYLRDTVSRDRDGRFLITCDIHSLADVFANVQRTGRVT
jgi:hypothetical protein